jgi:acyl CoA:acetate/3-ketoacid CoA transferase
VTGWIPTLSALTRHHKVRAFLLLIGIAIHLFREPVVVVAA